MQFHSFCWCKWFLTPFIAQWTAASVVPSAMSVYPDKMRRGENIDGRSKCDGCLRIPQLAWLEFGAKVMDTSPLWRDLGCQFRRWTLTMPRVTSVFEGKDTQDLRWLWHRCAWWTALNHKWLWRVHRWWEHLCALILSVSFYATGTVAQEVRIPRRSPPPLMNNSNLGLDQNQNLCGSQNTGPTKSSCRSCVGRYPEVLERRLVVSQVYTRSSPAPSGLGRPSRTMCPQKLIKMWAPSSLRVSFLWVRSWENSWETLV